MLLLSGSCSGSGGLNMDMLLSGERVLLLGLMRMGLSLVLLVLQPSRIRLGVLVLMGKDVLGLRLKHCGQRGRIWRTRLDVAQGG